MRQRGAIVRDAGIDADVANCNWIGREGRLQDRQLSDSAGLILYCEDYSHGLVSRQGDALINGDGAAHKRVALPGDIINHDQVELIGTELELRTDHEISDLELKYSHDGIENEDRGRARCQ